MLHETRTAPIGGSACGYQAESFASSALVHRERSWLEFCLAYTDMKWPSAAPKTRDALTDALATIIPAATIEPAPDGIDPGTVREALRHFALAPASRKLDRPAPIAAALCQAGRRARNDAADVCGESGRAGHDVLLDSAMLPSQGGNGADRRFSTPAPAIG